MSKIDKLLNDIKVSYGSLEQPNYAFMERQYAFLIRHKITHDLMTCFFVKDDTDLNSHAAMHLRVHDEGGGIIQLCLSFVDSYAMIFRFYDNSLVYSNVVDRSINGLMTIESDVLSLLEKNSFTVVCKEQAATPIQMHLYSTDVPSACVYHALIDDCGIIPLVLKE